MDGRKRDSMKRNEVLHAASVAELIIKLIEENNPNWSVQLEPKPDENGVNVRYTNENGELKQEWIKL